MELPTHKKNRVMGVWIRILQQSGRNFSNLQIRFFIIYELQVVNKSKKNGKLRIILKACVTSSLASLFRIICLNNNVDLFTIGRRRCRFEWNREPRHAAHKISLLKGKGEHNKNQISSSRRQQQQQQQAHNNEFFISSINTAEERSYWIISASCAAVARRCHDSKSSWFVTDFSSPLLLLTHLILVHLSLLLFFRDL